MPTEAENLDGSAALTFTRDASRPGYVHVEACVFADEDGHLVPLGTFPLRDLLIALHAVQVDPQARPSTPTPKRRWWER